MKKINLFLHTVINLILLNSISPKILLEDDFNQIDETKWDLINGKHHCNRKQDIQVFQTVYQIFLFRIFINRRDPGCDSLYDKQ